MWLEIYLTGQMQRRRWKKDNIQPVKFTLQCSPKGTAFTLDHKAKIAERYYLLTVR